MAQEATVSREATMDEILASIREIIEENTARVEEMEARERFVEPITNVKNVANSSERPNNEAVTRALQAAAHTKTTPPVNVLSPASHVVPNPVAANKAQQAIITPQRVKNEALQNKPTNKTVMPVSQPATHTVITPPMNHAAPRPVAEPKPEEVAIASYPTNNAGRQPTLEGNKAEVIIASRAMDKVVIKSQTTDVAKEKITVDDAMNALARRIGLNVEKLVQEKGNDVVIEEAATMTQEDVKPDNIATAETIKTAETVKQDKPGLSADTASAVRAIIDEGELYGQAEALVIEVLRPVLKKWLQQNLSRVVRKIMREELAKAVNAQR